MHNVKYESIISEPKMSTFHIILHTKETKNHISNEIYFPKLQNLLYYLKFASV